MLALRYDRDRGQSLLLVRPDATLDAQDIGALFAPARDQDPPRIFDLREPFTCRIEQDAIEAAIGAVRTDQAPAAATAIVAASAAMFRLAQAIAYSVNRRGPRRVQRVRAFHDVVDANAWLGADPWDDLERLRANLKYARAVSAGAVHPAQPARRTPR